ncbi:unnamed protein product [Musa acuminata subsp. malaccensis]|uniref:(wild Malaysian banana) hypothetical protein n=1 Tax=Musa acuminata subsp. malaccensis TaxID=214687 RepID=A0A804KRJ1_MUSAM|nr:unnamed protein product [Musa acuminata subsp. malaccensis]
MRTVVRSRASLLLTLVIIVFLVTARGETTPVKEAKAQIIYRALRPSSQPARPGGPYTRGCGSHYYCRPPSTPPPPPPPPPSTP